MPIRPTLPTDTPRLLELATATGVFKPLEIEALQEVLQDYHAVNRENGHRSMCLLDDRDIVQGFVYHAPAAMTDRTWHLWWIAVAPQRQQRGLGRELMHYVENDIRSRGGRLLLIETSSTIPYEPTRQFYLKLGYAQAAVIADFYADGDSMVIFRKHLS